MNSRRKTCGRTSVHLRPCHRSDSRRANVACECGCDRHRIFVYQADKADKADFLKKLFLRARSTRKRIFLEHFSDFEVESCPVMSMTPVSYTLSIPSQLRDSRKPDPPTDLTEQKPGDGTEYDPPESAEDVVVLLLWLRRHDVDRLYRNVGVLFFGHDWSLHRF